MISAGELIQKISQLSYQELDQFGNATLINRLTNDVNQVVMAVAYLIRLVSRATFFVCWRTGDVDLY